MNSWFKTVTVGLIIAAVIVLAARAQLNNGSGGRAPDSIVQITAEAEGLERISPDALPFCGTFWTVYANGGPVPMPCLTPDLINAPIYAITENSYLVDATGGALPAIHRLPGQTVTSSQMQSAMESQGNAIADLIENLQAQQMLRDTARMLGMEDSGPPSPAWAGITAGVVDAPVSECAATGATSIRSRATHGRGKKILPARLICIIFER